MPQDEIFLIDIGRILRREWRSFLIVTLGVLALALAYALLAKPRWEAVAWVQIGQVATAPGGQDPRPEPFQRTVERLQTRVFQDQVLADAGIAADSPEAGLYRGTLKVDPSPYAGLIKLSVRGASPEQARRLAQVTVDALQGLHRQIQAAQLAQAQARLDEVRTDLQAAQAERDGLRQAASGGGQGAAVAGLLLSNKEAEIRGLRDTRSDLDARLSNNYTFPTSMPWPIYQPNHPVSPNRPLIGGLGLLAGLGLGLFVAVGRDARRRALAQPGRAGAALTGETARA